MVWFGLERPSHMGTWSKADPPTISGQSAMPSGEGSTDHRRESGEKRTHWGRGEEGARPSSTKPTIPPPRIHNRVLKRGGNGTHTLKPPSVPRPYGRPDLLLLQTTENQSSRGPLPRQLRSNCRKDFADTNEERYSHTSTAIPETIDERSPQGHP